MSCSCDDKIGGRLHHLYRDRDNGVIFGVCAGLGHYFDVNVIALRIATIASLLIFFVPTVVTYGLATLLLKERSLGSCHQRDREFWRSGSDYGR